MTLYRRTSGVYTALNFSGVLQRANGVYGVAQEALVRSGGVYQNVWRADGPPPAPINLTSGAANGGTVTVGWAWAANIENDYNRVEVQQPGDIGRTNTAYALNAQQRGGYGHGASVALVGRSVDNGGQVSAWTPFPTVTALNALPPAAVFTNLDWINSAWTIKWNDPANPYGDISAIQVYIRNNAEGSWTLAGSYGYTGQTGRTITTPGRGWETLHHVFIRVVNNAGYTDSNTASQWTPPQPGTEKSIGPDEGNSFAYAANAWRDDGTVRQGMFAPTPMGLHFGCYFYGSKLYDAGHGYAPVSGEIVMMRSGTEGFTGSVYFTGHGYGTNPRTNPTGDGQPGWTSSSQFGGSGATAWESLPAGMLSGIGSGVTKGVGIFTFSSFQSDYKVFLGPAHNGFAGAIKLRW
jgi:hypothetical protein